MLLGPGFQQNVQWFAQMLHARSIIFYYVTCFFWGNCKISFTDGRGVAVSPPSATNMKQWFIRIQVGMTWTWHSASPWTILIKAHITCGQIYFETVKPCHNGLIRSTLIESVGFLHGVTLHAISLNPESNPWCTTPCLQW